MNKIKMAFIAIAILAAVGGAFATRPCLSCEYSQQYIWNGSSYTPVGEYGIDFDCWVSSGICTFYRPEPVLKPNMYSPCHMGVYAPQ
ncbi:hypothetical protein [Longitalea arenae]|uniref:hypothetical protein n=1 Tax=Longitalea arenae TaxID=2812558 RepID=UPI001968329A|nr:hypothetical protein [Longitalea arenae]